ncbi:hypothetical protein BB560_003471 [Smittium megazygosporum]|uniref:Plasma membrane fusion protein PRM1 n=1 Tax=Smittium megazygosporum TaxID=133381 RepID=A0A2T9ZBX4_9FUNG|nr:hypothetical protein BB560_003471 [Smittium megazygosporum]
MSAWISEVNQKSIDMDNMLDNTCNGILDQIKSVKSTSLDAVNSQINSTEVAVRKTILDVANEADMAADFIVDIAKIVVNFYYGTYICLIDVVVNSSLQVLSLGIQEVEQLTTSAVNELAQSLQSTAGAVSKGVSTISNGLDSFLNILSPGSTPSAKISDSDTLQSILQSLSNFSNDSNFKINLSSSIPQKLLNISTNLPSADGLITKLLNETTLPLRSLSSQISNIEKSINFPRLEPDNTSTGLSNSICSTQIVNKPVESFSFLVVKALRACVILMIIALIMLMIILIVMEYRKFSSEMKSLRRFRSKVHHYDNVYDPIRSNGQAFPNENSSRVYLNRPLFEDKGGIPINVQNRKTSTRKASVISIRNSNFETKCASGTPKVYDGTPAKKNKEVPNIILMPS